MKNGRSGFHHEVMRHIYEESEVPPVGCIAHDLQDAVVYRKVLAPLSGGRVPGGESFQLMITSFLNGPEYVDELPDCRVLNPDPELEPAV